MDYNLVAYDPLAGVVMPQGSPHGMDSDDNLVSNPWIISALLHQSCLACRVWLFYCIFFLTYLDFVCLLGNGWSWYLGVPATGGCRRIWQPLWRDNTEEHCLRQTWRAHLSLSEFTIFFHSRLLRKAGTAVRNAFPQKIKKTQYNLYTCTWYNFYQ